MSDERYDIIFRGESAKNVPIEQAKQNLAQLFNIDAAKVEALFTGKPVALKKGVSFDVAGKYRVAIKKAGAIVELVQCNVADAPQPTASAPGSNEPPKRRVDPEKASQAAAAVFTLCEVGADLLNDNEKVQIIDPMIDTSSMTVAPQDGPLVQPDEHARPEPIDIPEANFSVKEGGGLLVERNEIVRPEALDIDIPDLDIAEPGERLSDKKAAVASTIDVSHIQLTD